MKFSMLLRELDAEFADCPMLMADDKPSAEEFEDAIAAINITVGGAYKEFVLRYGGAIVGHLSIIGLRAASAMGCDEASFISVTRRFREERWPGTNNWLVFSIDLSGNPIGIDSTGSIWRSDHDEQRIYKLADSFEEFIGRLLEK